MSTLTKAGRYEIREELGRGAMGVVYLAHDPVIGRDVAVKTMHLSEAGTGMSHDELIGRFQTEARAAGLLTHPNIVVIYDAGEEEGLFYITMERVEGRSLQSHLDARQLFPLPRVLKLMEQVCSALDFAHQHNVVHRDIKPANLMLTADDTVKITDFGTAKILQFGTAQTSHVMGTPSYMSPEQVKGKPVDGRSDIFSLGVILYELMTGEKPFPGQNITTVIYKIINEDPIPPRSLDSSIHPGLSEVITRALSKDPATRFQTCNELLVALKNYRELVNPEATVRMAPVPEGARPNSTARRLPVLQPVARQNTADASPKLLPASPWKEELPEKRNGSVFLYIFLLGIIGYASYRIYPPMVDLWTRAHEDIEATKAQSHATAAPPAGPMTPSAPAAPGPIATAPETIQETKAASFGPAAQPASKAVPIAGENAPTIVTPQPAAAHAALEQKGVPIVLTGTSGAEKIADKSLVDQSTAADSQVSPAVAFESRLRFRLGRLLLADKVKTQVIANSVTLSGQLTPVEHRKLLNQLHAVPAGVRIVDDIEYANDMKGTSAPTTTGWVWVRSVPPGAAILVDGTDTGLRTPARIETTKGQHEIRTVLGGYSNSQRSVEVEPGQTMQITESLERP